MKKILLMLVLGFFSLVSKALPGDWRIFEVGGIRYMTTFYRDASVIFGGAYNGIINIPESITVDGYTMPVSSISGFAFSGCSGLVKVSIPKTVESIELNAFKGCIALESIVVDEGNKVYDSRDNCNAIIETKSNTLIVGCKNSVIPEGIKVISGGFAYFDYHDVWDERTEPDTYGAFLGCTGLQSISIPNSVTSIGEHAFSGCSNMKSITISNSITRISSYMFENCSSLSDITIPESVKVIDPAAFKGCSSLVNLYCNSMSAPAIYNNYWDQLTEQGIIDPVFDNSIQNAILHVKDYAVESFKGVEPWCNFKSIVVDEKVTDFNLIYYVDGEVYTTVQYKYDDIITPEPAPTKEGCTFSGWSEIPERMPGKDVNVNGSFNVNSYKITYLVDGEEYKSYNMKYGAIITPETEPQKEGFTFSGWSEIPESMPAKDITITGSFSINSYKLTYKVEGEEYRAFEVDYNEMITPEVEPIRKGMTFSGWEGLPEKMPAKDVEVTGFFSWSTISIDEVIYQVSDTINNYAAVIGNNEASGGVAIVSDIEFDYNYKVTSIADRAFNGCKDVTSIEIPATITNIGERAFAKIDKLTDVTITAEDVPTTDRTAFENSYIDYVTLHVPAVSVEKYKAIGPWKNFKEIVPIEGGNQTKIVSIRSVDKQKASYNLNGIKITKTDKTANGIIIRDGKKYYIK